MAAVKMDRVAYVFQGGGALGSYQVGAYKALEEAGYQPDMVSGVSIGSINSAIIAGNPPDKRLARLLEFWELVASPDFFPVAGGINELRTTANTLGAHVSLSFGQPGFFVPRLMSPLFVHEGNPHEISFYDTSPLRATLERLVDFDLINRKEIRLSVGSVELVSGTSLYFNNFDHTIGPEHIMASGALPPGFAAVEVEGKLYWDGGVLTNTPLLDISEVYPRLNTLCFMVDLFSKVGKIPKSLDQILQRQKDITYSSHSIHVAQHVTERQNLRKAISYLIEKLPESLKSDPKIKEIAAEGCTRVLHIAHMIYNAREYDLSTKDYNFSRAALREHFDAGYRDTSAMMAKRPWEKYPKDAVGAIIHAAPNNPFLEEFCHERTGSS